MRPARLALIAIVATALLATLLFLRGRRSTAPPPAGHAQPADTAPTPEPEDPEVSEDPETTGRPEPPPDAEPRPFRAAPLDASAVARPPHPWQELLRLRREALEKWAAKKVTFSFENAPIRQVLAFLAEQYGLVALLDPTLETDATVRLTFRELEGDRVLLYLVQSIGMRWGVDADGVIFITERDRPGPGEPEFGRDLEYVLEGQFRARAILSPPYRQENADARDRAGAARVNVAVVKKPLLEALNAVTAGSGLEWGWSDGSQPLITDENRLASALGQGEPLGQALDELLAPQGLGWRIEFGRITIKTRPELEAAAVKDRAEADARAAEEAETARFRGRQVSIEGASLSLTDVATQLAGWLSAEVRVAPALWSLPARWAGDGARQPVGEVLDLLSRDAPLDWVWTLAPPPYQGAAQERELWLLPKGE